MKKINLWIQGNQCTVNKKIYNIAKVSDETIILTRYTEIVIGKEFTADLQVGNQIRDNSETYIIMGIDDDKIKLMRILEIKKCDLKTNYEME